MADNAPQPKKSGGGFDLAYTFGIPIAFVFIILGLIFEHATLSSYVGKAAACFVFGGTFGVTLASVGKDKMIAFPKMILDAVKYTPTSRAASIGTLVGFAEKARREGLLVLEDDLRNTEDEFLRRGVQLVVDGTDPELVKEILRTEVDSLHEELHSNAKMFELMAALAPTMGIIGTVIGLVVVLGNMSDAASLASAISVAFLATLYGVGSANLLWLPTAMKLATITDDEVAGKEMMIEGILAIQSGDNPRIVEEKLVAFLNTKERSSYRSAQAAAGLGDDIGVAA